MAGQGPYHVSAAPSKNQTPWISEGTRGLASLDTRASGTSIPPECDLRGAPMLHDTVPSPSSLGDPSGI